MRNKVGTVDYKVLYAQAVYGEEEKKAVMESLENPWLADGPLVAEFEQKIAKIFGHQYGVATNSGSSANLISLQSLGLKEGGEVITPACTFSTVVSTIIHSGLVPVFVDSIIGRYTIDETLVEEAITPKTVAIMAPHLIGSPVDLKYLRELADAYDLALIDDSCDTLGVEIDGKKSGEYSDASTTSFYGSHIITALGYGGMVGLSDRNARRRAITLRDWGRIGGDKDDFEERFNYEIDGIPYDSKFLYSEFGYNLKMNEAAAAFGLKQLDRLTEFAEIRENNFKVLQNFILEEMDDFFITPWQLKNTKTSWLAFPLTVKETGLSRKEVLAHLEEHGIQTRVLFSGNITRHPVYRKSPHVFRVDGKLPRADEIMRGGFLIGCHQGLDENQLDYVMEVFKKI